MASSKSRQRQIARAKYERQMVRKAQAERKRRQIQAGVAAALVLLVTLGAFWFAGVFDSDASPEASDVCLWTPRPNVDPSNVKDVGTPSTTDVPSLGTRAMNITLNSGLVQADLDLKAAPCTSASFSYLATRNFFDNTKCHRLTDAMLQCGDPGDTGSGGPSYQYVDENQPVVGDGPPAPSASPGAPDANAGKSFYPRGTLATWNVGPGSNGSQFLIFYKDTYLDNQYSKFGVIRSGLDVIEKIGQDGAFDAEGKPTTDGKPKTDVVIQSLTVGEVIAPSPEPTPGVDVPSEDPEPSPTATPSPTSNS